LKIPKSSIPDVEARTPTSQCGNLCDKFSLETPMRPKDFNRETELEIKDSIILPNQKNLSSNSAFASPKKAKDTSQEKTKEETTQSTNLLSSSKEYNKIDPKKLNFLHLINLNIFVRRHFRFNHNGSACKFIICSSKSCKFQQMVL